MLGTILVAAIAYKIGKNNGEKIIEKKYDDNCDDLYKAQLKCISQCKAMETIALMDGAKYWDEDDD